MWMKQLLIAFVALAALFGYSGASTVTLTGTCTGQTLTANNSTLYFYLSNTGDGTATNLLIVPRLFGLSTYEQSENLSALGSSSNVSFAFHTSDFSYPGTYVGGFLLEYDQGSSQYLSTFPCMYSVLNSTRSLLSVQSSNITPKRLTLSLASLSSVPLNVTAFVLAPPTFTINPANLTLRMPPDSISTMLFNITSPHISGASFTISAIISYVSGGRHYGYLLNNVLLFPVGSGGSHPAYLLIALIAGIVAVILVLIAVALVKRRGEKKQHEKR